MVSPSPSVTTRLSYWPKTSASILVTPSKAEEDIDPPAETSNSSGWVEFMTTPSRTIASFACKVSGVMVKTSPSSSGFDEDTLDNDSLEEDSLSEERLLSVDSVTSLEDWLSVDSFPVSLLERLGSEQADKASKGKDKTNKLFFILISFYLEFRRREKASIPPLLKAGNILFSASTEEEYSTSPAPSVDVYPPFYQDFTFLPLDKKKTGFPRCFGLGE